MSAQPDNKPEEWEVHLEHSPARDFISPAKVAELLNKGWQPLFYAVTGAGEDVMYFKRLKGHWPE